jgi:hypothetical protein
MPNLPYNPTTSIRLKCNNDEIIIDNVEKATQLSNGRFLLNVTKNKKTIKNENYITKHKFIASKSLFYHLLKKNEFQIVSIKTTINEIRIPIYIFRIEKKNKKFEFISKKLNN